MFRKSLQILIAASMLAMAAVVAYATLLAPIDETLVRAEAMLGRGEVAGALAELNYAKTSASLRRDPVLHERLLRLRCRANTELGDSEGALDDVEALLALGLNDEELQLDRIRLRALGGDADGALLAARQFLERNPGHGRALELAGESCQTGYQPLLRDLDERIARDLPRGVRDAARTQLWSHLYRQDRDPEVEASRERLARMYAANPTSAAAWPRFEADLGRLRGMVRQALELFTASLGCGDKPVAAFRAVALAFNLSERTDDLLVACEIQRRRFDHPYVAEAGAAAASALLREGANAATFALVERWLPPGAARKQLDAMPDGTGVPDLMLARSLAAFALGQPPRLHRAWQDASQLYERKMWNAPAAPLTSAFLNIQTKDLARAEQSLANTLRLLQSTPAPIGQFDPLPQIAELHLDLLRQRNAPEADVQTALHAWRTARPDSIAPILAEVDVLQQRGRASAALRTIDDANALDPTSELLFARRVELLRLHASTIGQDGPTLVAQCLRRGEVKPEVADPASYLLCAEAALQQQLLPIAQACARAAVDAFPQARLPRLLEIRHAMASKLHQDALRQVQRLLELLPADGPTIELGLEVHRAAGVDPGPLLLRALELDAGGSGLCTDLLRSAIANGPLQVRALLPDDLDLATAPLDLLLLTAKGHAIAGDQARAATCLEAVLAKPEIPAALHPQLREAVAQCLDAVAARSTDADLRSFARTQLHALALHTTLEARWLLPLARRLERSHPATALDLVDTALDAATAEERDGSTLALAGRLALRAGAARKAEDRWTAALAFADGRDSAFALARLCLCTSRPQRASQVAMLGDRPDDAALAMQFGATDVAVNLLAQDLANDPADMLAHCLLALSGQPAMTDWPPATGEALTERLELLSILRDRDLATLALPRLREFAARDAASTTTRMLLARGLAFAGHGQEAATVHRELWAAGVRTPVMLREIASAAPTPGYSLEPSLETAVMDACTGGAYGNSKLTFAFGMQLIENGFRRAGHQALADQVRATLWEVAPADRPMAAEDITFVATQMPPEAAFLVLDRALTAGACTPKEAAITQLCAAGKALIATDPSTAPRLVASITQHLDANAGNGDLVHFLLDQGATPLPAIEQQALLRRQLAAVARGEDAGTLLPRTVARMVATMGTEATATQLDGLLAEHPTALALHIARAELARGTAGASTAITRLRLVHKHVHSPELTLALLLAAGEARKVVDSDLQTFARLPTTLTDSPTGRYTQALLQLRLGEPDAALPGLEQAPARNDGMHLYAFGLALLQSKAADGTNRAREAFLQLQRDYPSSSLAQNAGSFAAQLADR